MKEQNHNIHERIYRLVLEALSFIKSLPKSYINTVLIGQVIRSITSMGANDQEADGAFTKADFIYCYTIVRKEGKESLYWIRLLGDNNPTFKQKYEYLLKEGDE